MTPKEFAEKNSVSRALVSKWIRSGRITANENEIGQWDIPEQPRPEKLPAGRRIKKRVV